MASTQGRRGRRPAGQDTRSVVLDAARAEFLESGYEAASLRSVARRAGVDPKTVRHWYGDKTRLFTATLGLDRLEPSAVVRAAVDGPVDTLGERLVAGVLRLWDADDGEAVRLVFPAILADPALRVLLPQFVGAELLRPIVREIGTSDAQLRTSLVASQVVGLLVARHLVRVEPLASLPPAEVAPLVGPTIQRYLTGDLRPGVAVPRAEGHNSSHGE